MRRKQLNIRIPQSHLDRINELRGDLTQSEFVMRLVDEEWGRRVVMKVNDLTHEKKGQLINLLSNMIDQGELFVFDPDSGEEIEDGLNVSFNGEHVQITLPSKGETK